MSGRDPQPSGRRLNTMDRYRIVQNPSTGGAHVEVPFTGEALKQWPLYNKGTAFTLEERRELRLEGLLPPRVSTIEQQLERTYENYRRKTTDLERYVFLVSLQDRNETLFHRLVLEHIEEMTPIIYTPVVGEACQKYSHIYRRARGIFLTPDHRGRIHEVLGNAPFQDVAIIVVTDGERILGLGDQGAGGMGIPVGKLSLYTLTGGVHPSRCLPVTLDVGTENPSLLEDPLYLGRRCHRLRGAEYDAFIDEFVEAVTRRFPRAVLQWEDFGKQNAFRLLDRHRDRVSSFNDDIQGTGAVTLSGILAGLRITGERLRDQRVVIFGSGEAGIGISRQIEAALRDEGLKPAEIRRNLYLLDSRGLTLKGRPGLEDFKADYARDPEGLPAELRARQPIGIEDVLRAVKPQILIGVAGIAGAFTERIVRLAAEGARTPMIFALSNPTSKSECRPADAYAWTGGRCLIATGSPFANVEWNGATCRVGQGNNAFIFPGVGLGIAAVGARRVTDSMFLDAARALAGLVTEADLKERALYPRLTRAREVARAVAVAAARRAAAEGVTEPLPEEEIERRVEREMWFPEYLPYRAPRT